MSNKLTVFPVDYQNISIQHIAYSCIIYLKDFYCAYRANMCRAMDKAQAPVGGQNTALMSAFIQLACVFRLYT